MQILMPEGWKAPIGYANGIAVDAGRIVFVAGQVGWNAQQVFESEDLVPQFEQALKNVLAVLHEAGLGPAIRTLGGGLAYADLPDAALAILGATMIVGRIEPLVLIALFNPAWWR